MKCVNCGSDAGDETCGDCNVPMCDSCAERDDCCADCALDRAYEDMEEDDEDYDDPENYGPID